MFGFGIKLVVALIILVGGTLLLFPQNGVMAWMESGSITTMTNDIADMNRAVSDQLTSGVQIMNDKMDSSSERFATVITSAGHYMQNGIDTINKLVSIIDNFS